jgi:cob(I)alamin adenosyltransferase
MADRLTIITTRTGDDGTTGLADGSRVEKTNGRVIAMGEVDELNSQLGLLLANLRQTSGNEQLAAVARALEPVQHALFDLGSELAIPGYTQLTEAQLSHLDDRIEHFNAALPALKEFILPGASNLAALAHVARSVCRRAERSVVAVSRHDVLGDLPQRYLNRLSDLLFVLSRVINHALGEPEIHWQKQT